MSWESLSISLAIPFFMLRIAQLSGSRLDHLGRRDCVGIIQIDQETYGQVISQNGQAEHPELNWVDCSNRELRTLDISLTNQDGKICNLRVGWD